MSAVANNALPEPWLQAMAAAQDAPAPGWLQELRLEAARRLQDSGLPDRKTEAWKYTPLKVFEALAPPPSGSVQDSSRVASFPPALLEAAGTVEVADGMLAGIRADRVPGLSVLPLADAMDRFEDRLRPLIEAENINGATRAFAALNTAFLEHGLLIHVAQGVDAGSLLAQWAFSPGEVSRMGHFRIILLLENGAQLSLVEQFQSTEVTANALNVIIQAELGDGAELNHVRLQAESADATLLTSTSIGQAAGSTYSYRGFDLGCGLARHELNAQLSGPEAYTDISGAFVLDGRRHVDNHVSVAHEATDCRSEQFFRGVLGGRSRGVFNGRALIQAGADGSSVQQSNANLLLSDLAEMDTKPELEIYADEVEASHGATVGQLDENAVFYMRSRGLSSDVARRMLTAAFCHAVTDRLQDRELAGRIAGLVDAAMPGDGES